MNILSAGIGYRVQSHLIYSTITVIENDTTAPHPDIIIS